MRNLQLHEEIILEMNTRLISFKTELKTKFDTNNTPFLLRISTLHLELLQHFEIALISWVIQLRVQCTV